MRIQHNIMAMNAYRNYNNNTSALSKNLEKLSSGYKINRAGDDAAGLAISEKMRAQITGLKAASKNVKDGVSLVKTAEGALQEVHDMLNRMDSLATQSANGTYDNEVDRANLQKEVTALKSEIDRIADSSNFNGLKLLDGSLGEGKIDVSAAKIAATAVTPKTNAATGATSEFTVDKAGKAGNPYTMKVEYLDASGKSHTVEVKYTGNATDAKSNAAEMYKGLSANGELSGAFDMKDNGDGSFTFTSKVTGEKGAKLISVDTGDAVLTAGVTVTAGTNKTVEVAAAAKSMQAGDSLTVNGKTYEFVASADKAPTTDGAIAVLLGADEAASTANLNKALAGSGVEVTYDTNKLLFTAAKDGSPLRLQIGDTAEEFNQLNVSVGDMHSVALGIGDLSIADQDGAAKAIDKIKAAINTVSSTRGDLGAIQNRLEHTQNNLSVMTENIQDAESTIRDTDVADEMMAYTKNNILVQSAQAMLAQANQVPQGVLQLLQ